MPMCATDQAVVVGVGWYPNLDELKGPVNDATEFARWLTAPAGGGLCTPQVRLILSPPPGADPGAARPVAWQVQEAFDDLDAIARVNRANGRGLRVGRRLYLYFAGHGFAPHDPFAPRDEHTALLMANASRERAGYHISGTGYADWFYRAGYFDEVLLFMDCCREVFTSAPLTVPHFSEVIDPDAPNRVLTFYGFATFWSRLSREQPMQQFNGMVRGVFTTALLAGLQGGARDAAGRVTGASLRNYLFYQM
jgi:uncharacterized caspase-like protein